MLSPTVETGLFIALFVLLLVAGAWKVERFLWLAGFLLPLMTPRLTLAIGVDWHKVIGPTAVLVALIRGPQTSVRALKPLAAWFAYATLVSAVWMALEYAVLHRYWLAEAMGLGPGQALYKMPVQLFSFLSIGMCAWAVPVLATNSSQASTAMRGLIVGVAVSAAFGLGLSAFTGQGMLSSNEQQGIINLDGSQIGRVGGLSGEPKMLGAVLVVVVLFLSCEVLFSSPSRPGRTRMHFLLLFFLGALYATFSTSAWVALAVGAVALGYVLLRRPGSSRLFRAAAVVGVVGAAALATPGFQAALEARVMDRLTGSRSEVAQQKDNYIWEILEKRPIHGIWGFGFGGADLEAIPYVPESQRIYRRTPTAAATGARFFGDTGGAGLLAFIALLFYWSRSMALRGQPAAAAFALAGGVGTLSCSINALPCFLFLMGAYFAAADRPPPSPIAANISHGRGSTSRFPQPHLLAPRPPVTS